MAGGPSERVVTPEGQGADVVGFAIAGIAVASMAASLA
jgi:hypothetical protein